VAEKMHAWEIVELQSIITAGSEKLQGELMPPCHSSLSPMQKVDRFVTEASFL
jgi:hypothetical protein